MLTLNRNQLKRLLLNSHRCLIAVMLAGAFPASIYAQGERDLDAPPLPWPSRSAETGAIPATEQPVSYTHLTLPTKA